MPLLIEKYKPNTIEELEFNHGIAQKLLFMANMNNIPHIIISGPIGGGKKTLVHFYLNALYGPDVNNLSKCKYVVNSSSTKKEVEISQSIHHIVIEPTNTNHDRHILQGIIKQYAMRKPFSFYAGDSKFKTIVIHNIENLAHNSQAALRRTMEKHAKSCRFVMICNNLSKIIDPLKSRCTIFCVPLPSVTTIKKMLYDISIKERIVIRENDIKKIIKHSDNNLKEAIGLLDLKRLDVDPIDDERYGSNSMIMLDKTFNDVVELILRSMTANRRTFIKDIVEPIRTNIYAISITGIEGPVIITTLLDRMIDLIDDDEINMQFIDIASMYEFNLGHGRRDITHIDPIIFNYMQICVQNKTKLIQLLPKKYQVSMDEK